MGVSWTGLIGGGLGVVIMMALAISIGAGAGEGSRLYAIPLALLSAPFALGAYISVKPLAARENLLKGVVVVCLLLAIGGMLVFGAALSVVLTPPIALLAQAAGFIFQGSKNKK